MEPRRTSVFTVSSVTVKQLAVSGSDRPSATSRRTCVSRGVSAANAGLAIQATADLSGLPLSPWAGLGAIGGQEPQRGRFPSGAGPANARRLCTSNSRIAGLWVSFQTRASRAGVSTSSMMRAVSRSR
ncbi:hypothetical protein Aros01_05407 [Streptosporangium roseum]